VGQPTLDEHGRFVRLEIVKVRPLLPADLEEVAEAVAGDQTGRCAAMLNERISRHCRPVAEKRDVAGMRGDPSERVAKPVGDRLRRIGGGWRRVAKTTACLVPVGTREYR